MSKRVFVNRGDRYGRLTVIGEIEKPLSLSHTHHRFVLLKCDCGNEVKAILNNLKRGLTQSCGCYRLERQINVNTLHGMSNSRIWRIWVKMRERCDDPAFIGFDRWGGRGITYCKEWSDFLPFYEWAIKNGYKKHLTIDRINNDGNYEPSNCRWVTATVQQNNRGNNKRFIFNGESLTIPEICRFMGFENISHRIVWQKIHRDGMTIDQAVQSYKEYVEQVLTVQL
jgi:hypothetical protein